MIWFEIDFSFIKGDISMMIVNKLSLHGLIVLSVLIGSRIPAFMITKFDMDAPIPCNRGKRSRKAYRNLSMKRSAKRKHARVLRRRRNTRKK